MIKKILEYSKSLQLSKFKHPDVTSLVYSNIRTKIITLSFNDKFQVIGVSR